MGDGSVAMPGAPLRRVDPRDRRADVLHGEGAVEIAENREARRAADAIQRSAVMAIAPLLTIGLNGRLVPGCSSIELKGSPLGSTPTYVDTSSCPGASSAMPNVNGFETD